MGWLAKVKRRRGGVYVWRVDRHTNRSRRVTGYVGETVSFYFRAKQHMGSSHYRIDGTRSMSPLKAQSQPWSDLNPKMYKVIPLPWWLCWKWVLRPLETLVILATWPVYNDAKNRWNPRRIPRATARLHRAQRETGHLPYRAKVWAAHMVRIVLQALALVAAGIIVWAFMK